MESESYKIRCMIDGFFDRAVTKCTNETESQSTYDQVFSNFIFEMFKSFLNVFKKKLCRVTKFSFQFGLICLTILRFNLYVDF
jgi:hypothetical protein